MFCIGVCLFITFQGFSLEKTILISTGEYAPWTSETSPHGGFVNHVITEAFQKEGYTVIYRFVPWKRAYKDLKSEVVQVSSFWANHPSYTQDFYLSDPIVNLQTVFFYLHSKPIRAWKTITDLRGYQIGTVLGDTSSIMLKDAGLKVYEVTRAEQNIKQLLAGRIDITPQELLFGLELIHKHFPIEQRALITFDPRPMFESAGYLLISKKEKHAKDIVDTFNRGLLKLRKDGRYEHLYQDLLAGKYTQQH